MLRYVVADHLLGIPLMFVRLVPGWCEPERRLAMFVHATVCRSNGWRPSRGSGMSSSTGGGPCSVSLLKLMLCVTVKVDLCRKEAWFDPN